MPHSRALGSSSISTTCGGNVDHGMVIMVKNITFNSMIYNEVSQLFAEGRALRQRSVLSKPAERIGDDVVACPTVNASGASIR
jgi:hypothetical protein